MKKIDLYTDGACSGNPGPGGWGAVLLYKGHEKQISGYNRDTTNNRMEMFAVIMGLKELKEGCEVTVYTDSAYVFNAFDKDWITDWISLGWRTKGKKDVANQDLWKMLLSVMAIHKVNWVKVKGHSDNKYNNICDKLAVGEIEKARKKKV